MSDRLWSAVGIFVAAALSKEEAVAFPVFLATYEWLFRKAEALDWARFRAPLLVMLAVCVAVGGQALVATTLVEGAGAGFAVESLSPAEYFAAQSRSILLYLRLLVSPWDLNFDHDVSASASPGSWFLIVLAMGLAFWGVKRRPELYWILGSAILLAPTSSVFPLADLAAERRMLLPMVAVALLLGALIARIPGRWLPIALAIVLAGLTFQRNQVWSSAEALWSDAVEKSPKKVRPKLQLARLLESGKEQKAKLLADARGLEPENVDVLLEVGVERLVNGDPRGALREFDLATRVGGESAQVEANRGAVLFELGRAEEGEAASARALELDPCSYDARYNLALVMHRQGRVEDAGRLATKAPTDCRWSDWEREGLRELANGRAPR